MTYRIRSVVFMGENIEWVEQPQSDGSLIGFRNVEGNDGPERAAYLAWLAAGNTPEVIG